jgi:hypothetical protein
MPRVVFAPALQRHVTTPPHDVAGATLRAALDAAFAAEPRLRDYVVDEQGALRKHVTVFIDNRQIDSRRNLEQPIDHSAEIYVAQALSGG